MRKSIHWTTNRLLDLSAIFLLIMMLHISLDVILKYAINHPIQATLETVSYYYMVISVFLPIAFVEFSRQSIAVDVFYNLMPGFLRVACVGLAFLICIAVYGTMAWLTLGDAIRAFNRTEIVSGSTYMQIWPSRFVLPVSFLGGALVCLWYLIGLVFSKELRQEIMTSHQTAGDF